MKNKYVFLLFLFFILSCPFCFSFGVVYAEDFSEQDAQEKLEDATQEQLSSLDFHELQDVLDDLSQNSKDLFGSISFWDKVQKLLNGEFSNDFSSFFDAFINTFFGDALGFIPLLATIVIVTIFCSMISNLRSKSGQAGVGQIVNFVCFSVVVVIVSSIVVGLFFQVKDCVFSMQTQMNIIFPMLLTFLASVGGTVSVGIFQPAVAILSQIVVSVFVYFIMPLFVFVFVLTVLNNFSDNIKLNKMLDFSKSIIKWTASICFGGFLGILTVQGIVAGSYDGVSIKAAKFALKSYVPILGGYLSDGFNVAMAGSVLIKNAVGVSGIFLLCASVLSPLVYIIVFLLLLKLTSAILEPVGFSTIPNFLHEVSKMLGLLVMIVLAVAFMYIITIGLILCTANIF